jgi:hypothetical protein
MLIEHALLGARRAFSRLLKGVFFNIEKRFLEKRGAWLLKYLDSFYLFD